MPFPHQQHPRTLARTLLAFDGTLWLALLASIDGLAAWVPDPVARRRLGGEPALQFYFC